MFKSYDEDFPLVFCATGPSGVRILLGALNNSKMTGFNARNILSFTIQIPERQAAFHTRKPVWTET
jgi:hypothetical protein